MHSLLVTGRLISRAFWNGIANVSATSDPNIHRKPESQLISAVCGFSKERKIQRLIKGQFGDDAWFTAKYKSADVLGKLSFFVFFSFKPNLTFGTYDVLNYFRNLFIFGPKQHSIYLKKTVFDQEYSFMH